MFKRNKPISERKETKYTFKTTKMSKNMSENLQLTMLVLPAVILLFLFCYLPMGGTIIAFKDYHYSTGIFGSKWVGFDNFEFFFTSQDLVRVVRNTVGYAFLFIILKVIVGMAIALTLFEVRSKYAIKYYQTTMILPNFLSWVIVGYISYIMLNPNMGVLNQILKVFGVNAIDWYSKVNAWPIILSVVNTWKNMGMDSVLFYAALMGLNAEVFEAATIDGANKWQQIMKISIPLLMPITCIVIILAMGSVFRGDFGLFYQIPRDIGSLYPTTDVIDTYIYRGMRHGTLSMSTAVGLIQSSVGMIMVIITNTIVKRIDSESALY